MASLTSFRGLVMGVPRTAPLLTTRLYSTRTVAQPTVEFLFDVGSPASYLAYTQLPAIVKRTGANLVYVPVLVGGIFKATGNASPVSIPAKGKYLFCDLARHGKKYNVPYAFNPHFPINTLQIMRGATLVLKEGGNQQLEKYLDAIFPAVWANKLNMGDPKVVGEVLAKAGFDPEEVMKGSARADVKAELVSATENAVKRGAFGVPTFYVGKEIFFGQDRLTWVEEALVAAAQAPAEASA
eukprot:comp21880_c0_seq1/m.31317 comp21880_c0_seq1/g.31317  ORF comp21880_c0_seq1/g.31317 comp21880_c0_seq1/m.31317 type:complete len:240 (-) comp21880_c0_seq1:408-1127(-)